MATWAEVYFKGKGGVVGARKCDGQPGTATDRAV